MHLIAQREWTTPVALLLMNVERKEEPDIMAVTQVLNKKACFPGNNVSVNTH